MEFRHRRFRYWALLFAAAAVMLCGVSIYGTDDSSAVDDVYMHAGEDGYIQGQHVTVNSCDGNGVHFTDGRFTFSPGMSITIGGWTFSAASTESTIVNMTLTINPLDQGYGTTSIGYYGMDDAVLEAEAGSKTTSFFCNDSDAENYSYGLDVRTTTPNDVPDLSILFREGAFYHNHDYFPVYVGGFEESNKIEFTDGDYSWYSMVDGVPFINGGIVNLKQNQVIGVNGHVVEAKSGNLSVPCNVSPSDLIISAETSLAIDGVDLSLEGGTLSLVNGSFPQLTIPAGNTISVNGDSVTAVNASLSGVLNTEIEAMVVNSSASVSVTPGSKIVSGDSSSYLAIRNSDQNDPLSVNIRASKEFELAIGQSSHSFEILANGSEAFQKVQEVVVDENGVCGIVIISGTTTITASSGGATAVLYPGQSFGGSVMMNAVANKGNPTVWSDGTENKLLSGTIGLQVGQSIDVNGIEVAYLAANGGYTYVTAASTGNTVETCLSDIGFRVTDAESALRISNPTSITFTSINDVTPDDYVTIPQSSKFIRNGVEYLAVVDSSILANTDVVELINGKLSFSGSLNVNGTVYSGADLTVEYTSGNPVSISVASSGMLNLDNVTYNAQAESALQIINGEVNFISGSVSITTGDASSVDMSINGISAVLPHGSVLSTYGTGFALELSDYSFTYGSASYDITLSGTPLDPNMTVEILGDTVRIPCNIEGVSGFTLSVGGSGDFVFFPFNSIYHFMTSGSASVFNVMFDGDSCNVTLNSGSVQISDGGRLYLSDTLYLESASSFTVDRTDGFRVSLSAGVTVSSPADTFTAASEETVYVSADGYFDKTYEIAEGTSEIIRGTEYTAVGGPASVRTSGDRVLLLSGAVSFPSAASIYVGDILIVAAGNLPITVSVGTTSNTIILPAGAMVSTDIDQYFAMGEETLVVGSDGYFSKTYAVLSGQSVTINGDEYTATDGDAELVLGGGYVTLTSGSVLLDDGGSVYVGIVRVENGSDPGETITVSSAGTVSVSSGSRFILGNGTDEEIFISEHSAVIGFTDSLQLSLESGTVTLDVQTISEIEVGTVTFSTADLAVLMKDDLGLMLSSGNITVDGETSVLVNGRNLVLPAAATVDVIGTQATLTLDGNYSFTYGGVTYAMTISGGTGASVKPVVNIGGTHVSLPLTVTGITSYDVSVGTGADLGFYQPTAETVRLTVSESSSFTAGSDKVVMKGTAGKVRVEAGCPIWINDTVYLLCADSSLDLEYASAGKTVTIPAGKTATTGNSAGAFDSYATITETILNVGEDGYFSKTFTVVSGTTETINGMAVTAVGGNATVVLSSGELTLTGGTVSYGSYTVLKVGDISVESVGTSGTITVSSGSTIVLTPGQTVRLTSADEQEFTATADCTISFSSFPVITIVSGQYSLAVGESVIIDSITVENTTPSGTTDNPILVSTDKTVQLQGTQEVAFHTGTLDRTYGAQGQNCIIGFDSSLLLTLAEGTAVLGPATGSVTVGGIPYRAGTHGDAVITLAADGKAKLVSGSVVSDSAYVLSIDNPAASVSASAGVEVASDNGSISLFLGSGTAALTVGGLQYTYGSTGNVSVTTADGENLEAQIDSGSTFSINGVGITFTVSAAVASASISVQYQGGVPVIDMADYATASLNMAVGASNKVILKSADSEYRMAVPAGTTLSVLNGTITVGSTGEVVQTKVGTSIQSVSYGTGSGTGFTIAIDTSNDTVTVQDGMVSVGPGTTIAVENYILVSSVGTLAVSNERNIELGAGSQVSITRDNDSHIVKSTAATTSNLDSLMTLLAQYDSCYNEIRTILVDNPFGIDNTAVLQKMDALLYDCSLSYDANKDFIDAIYDEYNSAGRDDNESRFEAYKSERISELTLLHTAGECQKVSNLIDDCIDRIKGTHYNFVLTYNNNLQVLGPYTKDSILGQIDQLSKDSFDEYKARVLVDIDTLHIGETCTNEKAIIDDAHAAVESYQYDLTKTFEANRAFVDSRLSDCEMVLKEYRNVEDSFQIYKTVKTMYVSTQDTFGSEDVVRLIGTYAEKIRALNYSGRISLDENLARVDAVVAEFDKEVGQIGAKVFAADKNAVLGKAKALLAQYDDPSVEELINKAVFEIETYYYDSSVSYKVNNTRIADIYDTLAVSIADHMRALESKFNGYCQKYISVFTDRMVKPEYSGKVYQDLFSEVISSMEALTYDRNLGLQQNIERADDIAAGLQNRIAEKSSDGNRKAFEGYKADTVSYISKRVVSGATDAINDLVNEYMSNVIKLEYDVELTPEQNFEAVDDIRNEFDSRLMVLVASADFDRVVDAGVDYLEDRYGTNEGLAVRLKECIDDLRATPYNDSLGLEDNQKVIETKVNNYSVELFNMRQKTDQGSFVNYREYLLWEIGSKIASNVPDSLKTQAKEYSDRLKAVEYEPSSSYLWNKHVLQSVYDEYLDRVTSDLVQFFKDDCRAQLRAMDNGSSAVSSAVSKAESAIRGYKQINDIAVDLPAIQELFEYGKISVGYAVSQSDEASFNAYVQGRIDAIRSHPVSGDYLPVLKDNIIDSINGAISSGKSISDRSKAVEAFDRAFFEECRFINYRDSVADSIHRDHIFEDSAATTKIIDEYHAMVSSLRFDEYTVAAEGIAVIDGLYSEYYGKLYERRLLDNSTVCGDLNPDGTSVTTGEAAEYPEGSDEIWGIVGNIRGMGANSTVVFKPAEVTEDIFSKKQMPSETSTISVLSDGKVLGAFDVTIYNNGDKVRNFSGVYVVKILLPADMRGYETMQVAYVDEFGDVQVYDATVEGNFLVFSTTHFSTFYVVAVDPAGHSYYDAYLYAVIAIIVIVVLLLLTRVTVYRDGTEGSKPAFTVSVGKHDSKLAQPFSREGHHLVGWKRAGSEELIPADREMSQLGKYRILRLTAVWEEDSKGGKS